MQTSAGQLCSNRLAWTLVLLAPTFLLYPVVEYYSDPLAWLFVRPPIVVGALKTHPRGAFVIGRTDPQSMWFYPSWWGEGESSKQIRCGNLTCQFTVGTEGADVVAFAGTRRFLDDSSPLSGVPKLAFGLESPIHHYGAPLGDFGKGVDYSVSYDPRSSLLDPYGFLVPRSQSWTEVDQDYGPGASPDFPSMQRTLAQRRGILVVMSSCFWEESGRNWYIRTLSKFTAVHLGGKCTNNWLVRYPEAYKVESIEWTKFRFYLAFENSRCRSYITEKFFRSLQYGLIPIALGAPRADYEAIAETGSFLHVEDYQSPKELAAHIDRLITDDAEALKFHEWRQRWDLGKVQKQSYACLFCKALAGAPIHAPATYASRGAPYSRLQRLNLSDLPNQKGDCGPSLAPWRWSLFGLN